MPRARTTKRTGRTRIRAPQAAAAYAASRGLEVHAGHGLDFNTAQPISRLPEIVELNIGHFLIGEAIFGGLRQSNRACASDGRGPGGNARRGRTTPMIVGIGNDICDIRRIEKTLARYGERFLDKVFTDEERRKAYPRTIRRTLAKRFAAKEAMAKALGTGFRDGVHLKDIGVVNAPGGRPTFASRGAAARLAHLVPPGYTARIDVTLTDEYPLAEAVVIISAFADKGPAR